jgi:drug/metabolite transporter (DMT)-like permease
MKSAHGYLMVAGAALCWGLSATAAKVLLTSRVDTVLLVQMRATFAAVVLAALLFVFRRDLLRARLRDIGRMALLGLIGVAGANFTYYYAIREGSVATAIVMQYTAPLLVMGYAAWTGEEKLTAAKVAAACIAVAGCLLAVGGPGAAVGSMTRTGFISGALSSVTFGFMTVYTRHLLQRFAVWTVTVYSLGAASLFWMIVNPPWAIAAHSPGVAIWWALAGMGMISVLIPHSLYFSGLRHVVASRAIIVSTLEPIVAMTSAAVVVGEGISLTQGAGAALVLGAIITLQIRREPGGEEVDGGAHAAE